MRAPVFESALAPYFMNFVALKRAGGGRYCNQVHLLMQADRFFAQHAGHLLLTKEHIRAFLRSRSHLHPGTQQGSVVVLWQALAHARRHGAPIAPLPERPALRTMTQREPHIFSPEEFARVMRAALRPQSPRHPQFVRVTHATLFGLLVTTGLRVGEAVALDVGDLDLARGSLTVRSGKFRKARLLPLHETTVMALARYVRDARRPASRTETAPLFISARRQRLTRDAAHRAFQGATAAARVTDERGRRPRLHDLRHTYAVWRVEGWYQEQRDINHLLAALSTYMGHVDPAHTLTYLRSTQRLLPHANARYERSFERLVQGGAS